MQNADGLARRRLVAGLLGLGLCMAGSALAQAKCEKPLYLTFDTGHMGVAPLVAEVLMRQRVKATFFLANEKTLDGGGSLDGAWAPWWKARAAEGHATRMVREGFFAHVGPDGVQLRTRLRRAGFVPRRGPWLAGEVLGKGSGSAATPVGLVRGWLSSPSHRSILSDRRLDRIGVGLVRGTPDGGDGLTATVELGRR